MRSQEEGLMKHQSPEQLRGAAAIVADQLGAMTRRERLNRWADLLEQQPGLMEALYRIEYLSKEDRLAHRGATPPRSPSPSATRCCAATASAVIHSATPWTTSK
jgi:hypothetical protein